MKLILLFTTLVLSVTFLFIPQTEVKSFYPFSSVTVSADTYAYFLFEHLIVLILSVIIAMDSGEYRLSLWMFVVIQVVDVADYLLFYGEPWSEYLPSWNIIKVSTFGMVILYDLVRTRLQ